MAASPAKQSSAFPCLVGRTARERPDNPAAGDGWPIALHSRSFLPMPGVGERSETMKRFVSSGITSLAIVLAVASLAWAQNGGNNQGNNQGNNNNGNAGPAAAG